MESFRGRRALQRLFSTFPDGSPGVGLLLLRVSVGGTATVQGVLYLSGVANHSIAVWLIGFTLILCGLALTVGLLTPLAGLFVGLCVSGIALSWIPVPPFPLLDSKLADSGMIIIAVAIALLGPGAFSFDGYLFGRREIVIPPRPPES
jgi:putative oxidoreductase